MVYRYGSGFRVQGSGFRVLGGGSRSSRPWWECRGPGTCPAPSAEGGREGRWRDNRLRALRPRRRAGEGGRPFSICRPTVHTRHLGRELMAPRTDRMTRIPSGAASPITTNHAAIGSVFVDLSSAGNLKIGPYVSVYLGKQFGKPGVFSSPNSAGLFRTPYILHPTPYTIYPTSCTLHPTPSTLRHVNPRTVGANEAESFWNCRASLGG